MGCAVSVLLPRVLKTRGNAAGALPSLSLLSLVAYPPDAAYIRGCFVFSYA